MTHKLSILLVMLMSGAIAYAHHYDLTIHIEPNCILNNTTVKTKNGRLDLYKSEQSDIFIGKDSVIWNANLNETNYIVKNLAIGTYMIEYTPADTLLPTTKRIFYVNKTTAIDLDCYFFDLDYTPYTSTLEKGKSIVFYSNTYDGNPFRARIPEKMHTITYLKIERVKNKYYAHYVENRNNINSATINYFQQKSPYAQSIQLKKKDLIHIAQFEQNIKKKYFEKHPFYGKVSKFYFTFKEKHTTLNIERNLIINLKKTLWKNR